MLTSLKRITSVLVVILVVLNINRGMSENETATPSEPVEAAGPNQLASNPIRLNLPPVIHAVPSIEINVYFDNICLVLNPNNYAFDVHCNKGKQQRERWTFTPTEQDVGDQTLSIEVRDDQNQIIARAETIVRVVPANSGDGQLFSLLCIGDSLTHASVYPARILERSAPAGNPKLELIGSHWVSPGPVRHEGYGGWTALRFATHFGETARTGEYSKRGSPFLYLQADGKPKLDFLQYCQDVNAGKSPTHVTIFLGPNDIFSFHDETVEAGIDTMLTHYDQLIEMIRKSSPSTRIGLMLPVPPAATQDAFGSNYASGQTRWQYKRNQHRLVEKMLERYGRRDSELIDVIATHVNLDCVHNYPNSPVPANARSSEMIIRQNNGVHPAESGYGQIADTVYAWMKSTAK